MKILFALTLTLTTLQATANLIIAASDLTTIGTLVTTLSPTATTLNISGYDLEVVLREGPKFVVENAVYGEEIAPAALREQLNIFRSANAELARLSDIELTIALLHVEQE